MIWLALGLIGAVFAGIVMGLESLEADRAADAGEDEFLQADRQEWRGGAGCRVSVPTHPRQLAADDLEIPTYLRSGKTVEPGKLGVPEKKGGVA